MYQQIRRGELKCKLEDQEDLFLIEVLKPENFREYHIPGAINIPIDEDFEERVQREIRDKDAMVVVYCQNTDCDASEKAAERLVDLGYTRVFDYVDGKEDWKQAGMDVAA